MNEVSFRQKALRADAIAGKKQRHAIEESLKIIDTVPRQRSNGSLIWKRLRFNVDVANTKDIITVCNVFSNGAADTNEVHCLPDRTLWPFESWIEAGEIIKIRFPQ